jgi:hypothetical protein
MSVGWNPRLKLLTSPVGRCLSTEEIAALVVVDADKLEALLREEANRGAAY